MNALSIRNVGLNTRQSRLKGTHKIRQFFLSLQSPIMSDNLCAIFQQDLRYYPAKRVSSACNNCHFILKQCKTLQTIRYACFHYFLFLHLKPKTPEVHAPLEGKQLRSVGGSLL